MNIFFLDKSPKRAAQYHCDKHVIKMIIESAQLLYCAHWVINPEHVPYFAYKKTHQNHPCAIWVRKSYSNYIWLCCLALCLCSEYKYRYGSFKTHKTEVHIRWLIKNPPKDIPMYEMTSPPQAMPDTYKNEDCIEAYRTYYIESKCKDRNIVKYTRRDYPEFLRAYKF